jgi:hypothetical protein
MQNSDPGRGILLSSESPGSVGINVLSFTQLEGHAQRWTGWSFWSASKLQHGSDVVGFEVRAIGREPCLTIGRGS